MRFMLTENVPTHRTAAQREVTRIANSASTRIKQDSRPFPHVPKAKAVKVEKASYVSDKLSQFQLK